MPEPDRTDRSGDVARGVEVGTQRSRAKGQNMKGMMQVTVGVALCFGSASWSSPADSQQPNPAELARPAVCDQFNIDGRASTPLRPVALPPQQGCTPSISNGFPIPDPNCTPGAINPTLTVEVLRDRSFTTTCIRDAATQEHEKETTYDWYNLPHPSQNSGDNQVCELDHLISLELGGADTLDNIWPQCGPSGVSLEQRFFKIKDIVENFLAMQVRAGRINLIDAQRGIATDWTQFLEEARQACPEGRCF